jgi:hypothetical protein
MIAIRLRLAGVCALRLLGFVESRSSPSTVHSAVAMVGMFVLCMSLVMATTPSRAMDWTAQLDLSGPDAGGFIYSAEGPIDADDAQRLEKLFASKRSQVSKLSRSVVRLNSPGGSILGGLDLGEAIRRLGLATDVPASAGCHSACTFAFLGGVDRQVQGQFGIHALSFKKGTSLTGTSLDAVQQGASLMVQYARQMVGRSDMAEAALKVSASTIDLLPDNLLRDWNIITIASRPSQLYPPRDLHTINCEAPSSHPVVTKAVCNDLVLSRLDLRITAALAALKRRPRFDRSIELEQQRWSRYRDQCEAAFALIGEDGKIAVGRRTGMLGVSDCLFDVYSIRARELEALVAYLEAGETAVANKGWKTPSND